MSMLSRMCLCTLIVGGALSSASQAGIVLSVTAPSSPVLIPLAGTAQFSLGVQMAANVGTQEVLSYDLLVDLQAPVGKGLPTGWSVSSVDPVFSFPGSLGFVPNKNPGGGDAFGGDGSLANTATFTTAPLTLFNVVVNIDSTAQPGDYVAAFIVGLGDVTNAAGQPIPLNEIQANTANVTLTAVPEPGSLGMILLGMVGIATRRRRK